MEWSSFMLDVMYLVTIIVMLISSVILFWHAQPWPALFCLVPAGLSVASIRYRLRVAHYYLGRPR